MSVVEVLAFEGKHNQRNSKEGMRAIRCKPCPPARGVNRYEATKGALRKKGEKGESEHTVARQQLGHHRINRPSLRFLSA
ncbi:hypothetical protein L484_015989 [Morus notabilis]|uniref:Uncharacterized protein n=1 Tax=Morus notabilis TaxID=981085 RepID=W9RZ62_9ROSA|nr:hypothetical protein L484_015989 [Morus notabilis]